MSRPIATLALLLTTFIWGMAFVAQKSAMDHMGPLTFIGVRYLLGGLIVVPLAIREWRAKKPVLSRSDKGFIVLIAVNFFLGVYLQQAGLTLTTATNGGFLTSLYVLLAPLVAWSILGARPHRVLLLGIPLALTGVYWLNGATLTALNAGDLLVLLSAIAWAVQVALIGEISKRTGLPITISVISFATTAAFGLLGMGLFETPSVGAIAANWVAIGYAAVFSTAVAFTLQAISQQYVPPANAAIVLSAEGLFAAIGGAIFLGDRLPPIGYAGAALILVAITLVEVLPVLRQRQRSAG